MMVSKGVKVLREYTVNLIARNGFDVLRTIHMKGYSRDEIIDKLNIEYFKDDEVMGYQFEEVR